MKMDDKYLKTDQKESRRIRAIYSNPKAHAFYSEYEEDCFTDRRGPKGGKIRGRKTYCTHCGQKKGKHGRIRPVKALKTD